MRVLLSWNYFICKFYLWTQDTHLFLQILSLNSRHEPECVPWVCDVSNSNEQLNIGVPQSVACSTQALQQVMRDGALLPTRTTEYRNVPGHVLKCLPNVSGNQIEKTSWEMRTYYLSPDYQSLFGEYWHSSSVRHRLAKSGNVSVLHWNKWS